MSDLDAGRGRWDADGESDAPLGDLLRVFDPTTTEANYWLRFQSWVVESAGPELARRRLIAELTVGDVLTAWSRTLVPTALLAAAVAAFMFLRPVDTPLTPIGVDELLVAEVGPAPIPEVAESQMAIAFSAEHF